MGHKTSPYLITNLKLIDFDTTFSINAKGKGAEEVVFLLITVCKDLQDAKQEMGIKAP